jgi:fucose 4-O-acetylase-like acetyltransferase
MLKKQRLTELDIMTGIAIFFVVLGHIASRNDPNDIFWYSNLKILIYKFHMPLFMFVSGSIAYYSYLFVKEKKITYLHYIKNKSFRLLPGFFLFAFIIIIGKFFANIFLHVDNFNSNILENIYNVLFFPAESLAGSLWYIYVLFQFYLLLPLIEKFNKYILLLFAFILHILNSNYSLSDFLMLNKFSEYLFFFTLGFIFINKRETIINYLLKYKYLVVISFIFSFLLILITNENLSKLVIGCFSIPFFILFSIKLNNNYLKIIINLLSEYTYSIYLMNTIFIGLTKGIFIKFLSWGGINFIIMFPFLLLSGLILPILFHKIILEKTFLKNITK